MPGITGIIANQTTGKEAKELEAMLGCMMHEPFYNCGTHINSQLGVYVGYVSIDGSFPDCMPIYNEKKNLVMFFSGECFFDNDMEIKLKSSGHEFEPGNASSLIHLYEEQGEMFLKNLNGWFSGILIDSQKSKVILFNDRYGIQRINYYENDEAFYFSSEAKSILKVQPSLRNVDPESMSEYFCYDCVLKDRTYFSNIFLLPSGSAWIFANKKIEKKKYFDPVSLENQSPLSKDQFLEELGETFKKILPRYFSEEKIGFALTGGLDTRMILACLNSKAVEMSFFTFGGMYRDSFDVRLARQIAEACNQSHQTLRLDNRFLSEFPTQAEKSIFITDGLADITNFDGVYLNNLAQQISPIKMTGKFGSQVMGRVRLALRSRFPNGELINQDFKKIISNNDNALSEFSKEHKLSFILYREIPWYWARFTAAELSQLMVRSPYLDNDFVSLMYRAPVGFSDSNDFQLNMIKTNAPDLFSIRTNGGLAGGSSSLFSNLIKLRYQLIANADKALNWDILPYSLHHWLARLDNFTSPLHPIRMVLGMSHFRHHGLWFRKELSQYLQEMTLDQRTLERPYWNKKFLRKIVNDHIQGRGHYLSEIRKILTSELIHRVLVEDL